MKTMYYGAIIAASNAAAHLKSLGVELGDYDYSKNVFYARASEQAIQSLADFAADYSVSMVERIEDENFGGVRALDGLGPKELRAELAYLEYLIHSENNDGRLSSDSSAWLDLWSDDAETIRQRLAQIGPSDFVSDNLMRLTKSQFDRTVSMFVQIAKEPLDVDFCHSSFYVFGSEAAILRLAQKYGNARNVSHSFSETFQSHYFRLDAPAFIGEMTNRPDVKIGIANQSALLEV